jgi:hypothetical protein
MDSELYMFVKLINESTDRIIVERTPLLRVKK